MKDTIPGVLPIECGHPDCDGVTVTVVSTLLVDMNDNRVDVRTLAFCQKHRAAAAIAALNPEKLDSKALGGIMLTPDGNSIEMSTEDLEQLDADLDMRFGRSN